MSVVASLTKRIRKSPIFAASVERQRRLQERADAIGREAEAAIARRLAAKRQNLQMCARDRAILEAGLRQ